MKILFYDGECGVCDTFVQFVLKHENDESIRFCQIQSYKGHQILSEIGVSNVDMTTVYFWDEKECYFKSHAIFEILKNVSNPYRIFSLLRFLPRSLTDVGYAVFSKRRQFFSALMIKKKSCDLLPADVASRFIS